MVKVILFWLFVFVVLVCFIGFGGVFICLMGEDVGCFGRVFLVFDVVGVFLGVCCFFLVVEGVGLVVFVFGFFIFVLVLGEGVFIG